ncbi:MAG TPA: hypothetical protein P5013_08715, partial [Methanoregula sp.]|nr:hypothetical protein [Methanoregula sp.]
PYPPPGRITKQQMTYLEKPRWIDSEDQDRPFPVVLLPTSEELETAEPVQFSEKDDLMEYAADLPCRDDESDMMEARVLIAEPDPLLDGPEWGIAKNQPVVKKLKESFQSLLDVDS